MKTVRSFQSLATALAALHFAACSGMQITHVAPGKSAAAAIAERNKAKETPPPALTPAGPMLASATPGEIPSGALPPLPAGDVKIPSADGNGAAVADAFSRGTFAMQAGQDAEAIAAFEQVVKLDPDFTDAWSKLAMLYQKTGNNAKAMDAFKKAKRLGDVNPSGTAKRDGADPVLFP